MSDLPKLMFQYPRKGEVQTRPWFRGMYTHVEIDCVHIVSGPPKKNERFKGQESRKPGCPCSIAKQRYTNTVDHNAPCWNVSTQQRKNIMCCCITIRVRNSVYAVSISEVYVQSIQAAGRHGFCSLHFFTIMFERLPGLW